MCHLILLMPVVAIPIFWLVPLSLAIPVYMLIVLMSGLFYWLITKSMMKPVATGAESLFGTAAEVVSILGPVDHAQYLVRAHGELWSASCPDVLRQGEMVNIRALDGIRVIVERVSGDSVTRKPSKSESE